MTIIAYRVTIPLAACSLSRLSWGAFDAVHRTLPEGSGSLADITEAPHPESQLATGLVEGLVRQIQKCLAAMTLYSPSHPMYLAGVEELKSGFEPLWEESGSLTLEVRDHGLAWESHVVLPEEHTPDSISWGLFKDGIRSITLTQGVEEEEIVRLLEVIHQSRSLAADAEDDLLTLLWGQYFEHIRYRVVDLGADDFDPISEPADSPPPSSPEATQQQVEEEVAESTQPGTLAELDDFDASLYFLDDHEIDQLKEDIANEYTQNICVNALSMLLDIVELHPDGDVREETCGVLEALFPHLLGAGDFGSVAYMIREVGVLLERVSDLDPEHQRSLAGFASKLSSPQVITQVLQSLDDGDVHPTPEELGDLFGELGANALMMVLRGIPQLDNEAAKGLLRSALGQQAKRFPEVVKAALGSPDRDVVLVGLRCVQAGGLTSVHSELGRLSHHEDTGIRRTLVGALAELATSEALRELEELLHDPDHDIRIAAVRALSTCGDDSTRSLVESIVLGRAIRETDRSEKLAFFEAYGALFGESAIASLHPLLQAGLLRRRSDSATRACVARVLGQIGGPKVKVLLEKALDDRDFSVSSAAERGLNDLD